MLSYLDWYQRGSSPEYHSLQLGLKTKVEYVTKTGLRLSGEAIPIAILVTNGVGKGDLGMMVTFCSHNQVKMEASEVLTTFTSVIHLSLEYSWYGGIPAPPSFPEEPPGYSTLMWLTSPRALLPPRFLWMAYIFGSYFHISRLWYSYPGRRELGIEPTPFLRHPMETFWRGSMPLQFYSTIYTLTDFALPPQRRHADRDEIRK